MPGVDIRMRKPLSFSAFETDDAIFVSDGVIATLRQARGKPPRRHEDFPVKPGKNEAN